MPKWALYAVFWPYKGDHLLKTSGHPSRSNQHVNIDLCSDFETLVTFVTNYLIYVNFPLDYYLGVTFYTFRQTFYLRDNRIFHKIGAFLFRHRFSIVNSTIMEIANLDIFCRVAVAYGYKI